MTKYKVTTDHLIYNPGQELCECGDGSITAAQGYSIPAKDIPGLLSIGWLEKIEPEEKEYEILKKVNYGPPEPEEIHSVKRLSDGAVFEVEGYCKAFGGETIRHIKSFQIDKHGNLVASCQVLGRPETLEPIRLGNLSPAPECKPLFRSEDGVDMMGEEQCYAIFDNDDFDITGPLKANQLEQYYEKGKVFASLESAQNHVINNKPVFCFSELWQGKTIHKTEQFEEARKRCGFTREEAKKRAGI
jgi:hypothetical protein